MLLTCTPLFAICKPWLCCWSQGHCIPNSPLQSLHTSSPCALCFPQQESVNPFPNTELGHSNALFAAGSYQTWPHQRSSRGVFPIQMHGMESKIRRGRACLPCSHSMNSTWSCGPSAHVRLHHSPSKCFPLWDVASDDIGKQMFLSWKSSSWILDCVYIPRRYATWKRLEIGNRVLAEQVKGTRWKKKNHCHHFLRDLPNFSFLCLICTSCRCVWSNFPPGIFLLHGMSSTDAHSHERGAGIINDKWNTDCQGGVWGRGCDPAHTHRPRGGWALSCVVINTKMYICALYWKPCEIWGPSGKWFPNWFPNLV